MKIDKKELVRTDRNGTKYWLISETCPHCGGRGDYVQGGMNFGTCFQCGGSGIYEYTWKEYTPEHEAELEAKRLKRAEARLAINEAKQAEAVKLNMTHEGFNADGIGFIHYGNTYKAKEALKNGGAKWHYDLKAWLGPKPIDHEGVCILEVKAADLCTDGGIIDFDKAYAMRKEWA